MLRRLGVRSKPSTMSFSVRDENSGLEYNGTSLNTLFVQRRNLLRPAFLVMVREIIRFNQIAQAWLAGSEPDAHLSLGSFLENNRFSAPFIDWYVLPMGSAIWSSGRAKVLDFPALFFLRFLENHGMLTIDRRPTWRVVEGGSQTYVAALCAPFRQRIMTSAPVSAVLREGNGIRIFARGVETATFDQIILAVHADQALAMLVEPTRAEREVLSAFRFQANEAVLHLDTRLLPRNRKAWASWNYHLGTEEAGRAAITYNMNISKVTMQAM